MIESILMTVCIVWIKSFKKLREMIKNKTTMNYGKKNIPLTDGMTTLCYNTIEYTFYIVNYTILTFSPIVGPLEWYKVVHVYANTSIYITKKKPLKDLLIKRQK